jgi:2-aminoadipate transaminase
MKNMTFDFSDKVKGLKPSAIREIFKSLTDPEVISFAAGNPSPLSFPVEKLRLLADEIFETEPSKALQYGITEGYSPLREQVAQRLKSKFSTGKDFDEVIITSGGQQGIDLACKVLCNEGDTVICENPSFIGALNAFRSYGVNLKGIDAGEDGIDPEKLEKMLCEDSRVKLIYLIPTFQNPSGITTTLEKRKAILEIAKKHGVVILEDNPYGELRFAGTDVPTIKSMDGEGIVLYCGSFSKILSSGMRVGFLCGHKDLISKIVVVKQTNDVHTNQFFQMLCSKFIDRYGLDEHIKSINALYGKNCALMLSSLDESMPRSVSYTRPEGGLFLWVTMPENTDMREFIKRTVDAKIAVVPGETFMPDTTEKSFSFRLNYSMPTENEIIKGISILSDVIKNMGIN